MQEALLVFGYDIDEDRIAGTERDRLALPAISVEADLDANLGAGPDPPAIYAELHIELAVGLILDAGGLPLAQSGVFLSLMPT